MKPITISRTAYRGAIIFMIALLLFGCRGFQNRLYAEADGHQFTNRLLEEKSPYLQQHAHNPVDWYPWGEEAFNKARTENKPIFLSIGYSTCHWCHVMERESFSNPDTAKLMNTHFINIKVDREERPDVDKVYMTFVQATTGSGGWPLNVWLTPGLEPFFGGTYFPPEDRWGRPGLPTLIERIADFWENERENLMSDSRRMTEVLRKSLDSMAADEPPEEAILAKAYDRIAASYDAKAGGFGAPPKFPRPATFNFLMRYHARFKTDSPQKKTSLEMVLFTLRQIAKGGIHDHIGGGFHRYSVDTDWQVPHFEKMLYNQAQLAAAYLDAWQITGDSFFAGQTRGILEYVLRDMTHPDGGFYSAEDADSLLSRDGEEKAEGVFYLWTEEEIIELLGERDASVFNYRYGVESNGNVAPDRDPHGEFSGKNILLARHSVGETVEHFKSSADATEKILRRCRAKLLAARNKRPRPELDDKVLSSWNGLMISTFARAGRALEEDAFLQAATEAAVFLNENLYDADSGTLLRFWRNGAGEVEGFADDYAYLIQGLLDLYEATFEIRWVQWALKLQEKQDELFLDRERGGYFSVSGRDPNIIMRLKEDYDGSVPAPSSVAALNLLRLGQMTGNADYHQQAEEVFKAFGKRLNEMPRSLPQMLGAYDFYRSTPKQIIIAGGAGTDSTLAMLREIYSRYLPNKIVLLADAGEGQAFLAGHLEIFGSFETESGESTAYICENYVCKLPTTDVAVVAKLLSEK